MDRSAGRGTVNVQIRRASIDLSHHKAGERMAAPAQLDATKYPAMTHKGKLDRFVNGAPPEVNGELTTRGSTQPVALEINLFKCIAHPLFRCELCGAGAFGTFDRSKIGLDYGEKWGFKPDVTLRIQVEALAEK